MGYGLSSWNDNVASSFKSAINNTDDYLNNEINKVNTKLKNAQELINQRIPVSSRSHEIKGLYVEV